MNKTKLVIKQQRPRHWYVLSALSLIFLFIITFLIGRYLALADLNTTKTALTAAEQNLLDTQLALESASEKLIMQRQSSQVDDLSNQELVSSVKKMQLTQNSLEEELKFYRKIMAPELDKDGLAIDSIAITKTGNSNSFHFRATLIQAGKQSQFLKGELLLKLVGQLNGKPTEYDFRELGTFNTKHFQFQFKYFQNIQGNVLLPNGFKVEKIGVIAQTRGRRKNQKVQKELKWQPVESQNYVR